MKLKILTLIEIFLLVGLAFCLYKTFAYKVNSFKMEKNIGELESLKEYRENKPAGIDPEPGVTLVRRLRKDYKNIKARIYIKDTGIDFPIVQGTDNDFYLDHDYKNGPNLFGAIFIDSANKADFSDQNTIIYGHNVRAGYIFHDLDKFRDDDFTKDHPYIIIDTPNKKLIYELVGAMDLSAYEDYRKSFYKGEDFKKYIRLIKENNILKTKVTLKEDDKFISLSTCSDINDRFVIIARLVK